MKRWLPDSLFGQTLLVLLAGVLVSVVAGAWIYTADREQAVRAVGGFAAADRIANLSRLVMESTPQSRSRIVAAISDRSFAVSLGSQPLPAGDGVDETAVAVAIREFLVEELSLPANRMPRVSALIDERPYRRGAHQMRHGPMEGFGGFGTFGGGGGFRELRASIPLADGSWLTFATALPEAGRSFSGQFFASMAVMALIVLLVSGWVVRRVTSPLATLAVAAERLGRDVNAAPLPETGSRETRQASRAFNNMQVRLRNMIDNRTRLLAAISHDLRTPLTLLRLRAESVDDVQERERMLSTIGEMDAMVGATLNFARDETVTGPRKPLDLTALVQSVVDDMGDAGLPVTMAPAPPLVYEGRSTALRRALTNLVDNAVKYGKTARVALSARPDGISITIDDDGPGIPDEELRRVFEPFYRVESSRNAATGGVGLGLAIALSAIEAHGGELVLENRRGGGLRARVRLPS